MRASLDGVATAQQDAEAAKYGVGLASLVGGRLGFDRNFTLTRGRRAVAESVLRRWRSPKGSLITDPDAGVDVREWLSSSLESPSTQFELRSVLIHEALRDVRVAKMDVRLVYVAATEVLTITARAELVGGEDLAFTVDAAKATTELFRYLEAA